MPPILICNVSRLLTLPIALPESHLISHPGQPHPHGFQVRLLHIGGDFDPLGSVVSLDPFALGSWICYSPQRMACFRPRKMSFCRSTCRYM